MKNRFLAYETEYIELRDFYEIIDRTEDIVAIDNDYNTIRSFVEGVLQRQKTALTIKDSPLSKKIQAEKNKEEIRTNNERRNQETIDNYLNRDNLIDKYS